jgi:hypothetical protein
MSITQTLPNDTSERNDLSTLTGQAAYHVSVGMQFLSTVSLVEAAATSSITTPDLLLIDAIQPRIALIGASTVSELTTLAHVFNMRVKHLDYWFDHATKNYNGVFKRFHVFTSSRPRVPPSMIEGNLYSFPELDDESAVHEKKVMPANGWKIRVNGDVASKVLPVTAHDVYHTSHTLNLQEVVRDKVTDGTMVTIKVSNSVKIVIPKHVTQRKDGQGKVQMTHNDVTNLLTHCTGQFQLVNEYETFNAGSVEIASEISIVKNQWSGAMAIRPHEKGGTVTMYGSSVNVDRIKVVCQFTREGRSAYNITGVITLIPIDAVERVSLVNRPTFASRASDMDASKYVHVQGCEVSPEQYDSIRRYSNQTEPWSHTTLGIEENGDLKPIPDDVDAYCLQGSSKVVKVPYAFNSYTIPRASGIEVNDVALTMRKLKSRNLEAYNRFISEVKNFFYMEYVKANYHEGETHISLDEYLELVSHIMTFSVSIGMHNEMIECKASANQEMLCEDAHHMDINDFFAYHYYCLTWRVRLHNGRLPLVLGTWMSIPYFCPAMPDSRGFPISTVAPWCSGFFKHIQGKIHHAFERLEVTNPLSNRPVGLMSLPQVPKIIGFSKGILTDGTRSYKGERIVDGEIIIMRGNVRLCLDNVIRDAIRVMKNSTCGIIYDARFVLLLIKGGAQREERSDSKRAICFVTTSTKIARILPSTKNSDALVEREAGIRAYVHEYDAPGVGYLKCI